MLPPGDTTVILFHWNLRPPPGGFGLLQPLRQQRARKEGTVSARVVDSDYQREIGVLLHNGGEEVYA